ncbi:hypothetical protein J2W35_002158 [Variovorax boronicumulans]|uniref:hypothetical protein n=1 Tax=Variovorax boronicumulans TaxID=436515 RepID=UPI00278445BF|nr:hypothetical protein [Variovorax boronicumulans]MDQ0081819.1 hypothetical protein [Variovorax boronicumulans]
MTTTIASLDAEDIRRIAAAYEATPMCAHCAVLACPGWEAFPGTADESMLKRLGKVKQLGDVSDATLDEHHPSGTSYWSPDAPIALGFHPYNRCEIWACKACARPFLRYTEYGGYYEERRIRELRHALLSTAA